MMELANIHHDPVFLRREALEHGYTDKNLRSALRDKAIVRIRQGTYTTPDVWQPTDAQERHRLAAAGVLLTHGDAVMLSHTSAAVEHGLRVWQPNLAKVHVTRLDGGTGRVTDDIVYHEGTWTPDDVVSKDDKLLVMPVRAGLEAATLTDVEGGMVVLDSLLDLDLATEDELSAAAKHTARWPHHRRLQVTVRLVRRGAQSVGESRGRYLCWSQHLPEPQLQFEVRDESGEVVAVTYFGWPELGVLGEFDGRLKYGRLLKPGEEPGDAVFREKQREDLVRSLTQCLFVRMIWRDLYRPRVTAARIRTTFSRSTAARRPA
ncbi:hypothetical protein [Nocardioides speluncae]|uniref:hypothetical protein n=1 Tax=Nocardioides speluncae TaxID=2670337 RepID=UPI000D6858D2|nr:hypothetical protein [Nocardioides speluncae]